MNGLAADMALGNVLRRLQKVRKDQRKPNQWVACCPAHDDRNPSLAIHLNDKGVALYCFAGCPTTNVLQALGLTMRDLFPDFYERQQNPTPYPPKRVETRREVAVYDYRDEQGTVLYQVVRFDPKGFAQRRPDPQRPGKWLWGLVDTRRVLYKLPEILSRPQEGVVIVEGEKDVEALFALGLLATCNQGGTGMSWRDDYSKFLVGRRVVVVPDNDPAGLDHADLVAGNLIRHGAASVRYLMLPGMKDKQDVSDWIAAGGTKDELVKLIKAAPEWAAKKT